MNQPALFPAAPAVLEIPEVIDRALGAGATLAVSISGGKDSQAMANDLSCALRKRAYPGVIFALHMDLGRAEWPQTPAHVERIATENGLELVVVRRPQGDLVQEIADRMEKLRGTGKPFWPSAASRYCTADQKRNQADRVLRNLEQTPFWPSAANRYCTSHHKTNQADKVYRRHDLVISAEGIRAEESPRRRRFPAVSVRSAITSKPLKELPPAEALAKWLEVRRLLDEGDAAAVSAMGLDYYTREGTSWRLALTWYPLHEWGLDDVWRACGTSAADLARRQALYREGKASGDEKMMGRALVGWPAHVAYVFGNTRLSCVFCVLATENDLRNGAEHNPGLFRHYVSLERAGGSTFKNGFALEELAHDLGIDV